MLLLISDLEYVFPSVPNKNTILLRDNYQNSRKELFQSEILKTKVLVMFILALF